MPPLSHPPYFTCSVLHCTTNSPIFFLLVCFFTGFSLSTFVSTQFRMSSMFSAPVVGFANGVAGGWGNLSGGATQLLMPLVYSLIHHLGETAFTAWHITFFIPALFQTLTAFAILIFVQDLPEGNFKPLHKSGERPKDKLSQVFYHGVTNYRGWILALTYVYCFGVELTVDNIIAQYFHDRFNLKLETAGIINYFYYLYRAMLKQSCECIPASLLVAIYLLTTPLMKDSRSLDLKALTKGHPISPFSFSTKFEAPITTNYSTHWLVLRA